MFTEEQHRWFQRDMAAFDRLPREVRVALYDYPHSVDAHEFCKQAKTKAQMLKLIAERKVPT